MEAVRCQYLYSCASVYWLVGASGFEGLATYEFAAIDRGDSLIVGFDSHFLGYGSWILLRTT